MKASDAHVLLEIVVQASVGKEGAQLDELKRLANVLRDEIVNAEEDDEEPDTYSTTVTARDLEPPAFPDWKNTGASILIKAEDMPAPHAPVPGVDFPTATSISLEEEAREFDITGGREPYMMTPAEVRETPEFKAFDSAAVARELAEDHRVFVVDEPVPAGSLPPDELVFRKAKT